jgi:hypothetical protein
MYDVIINKLAGDGAIGREAHEGGKLPLCAYASTIM